MRSKAIAAMLATATATGVGGFLLGFTCKDSDRFIVHAQLKDVLQPVSTRSNFQHNQSNPFPGQLQAKSDSEVSPVGKVHTEVSVGPHRTMEIMAFGYPSSDSLRAWSDYVLAYDR